MILVSMNLSLIALSVGIKVVVKSLFCKEAVKYQSDFDAGDDSDDEFDADKEFLNAVQKMEEFCDSVTGPFGIVPTDPAVQFYHTESSRIHCYYCPTV